MIQDQSQGKWEALKAKAKELWMRLSDDDFTKAEESPDKLYDIIREKYGHSKEDIHKRIFIEREPPPIHEVPVLPAINTTRDEMHASIGRMEAQLMQWGAELDLIEYKADRAGIVLGAEHRQGMDMLRVKHEKAKAKLEELKAASSEKWDSFKTDIETAWAECEDAFKKMSK
jgi:uncharacterized protein YjbJ (UPF0337 family)